MTEQYAGPTRELLEAGLHRLAQPLTSALWIAETSSPVATPDDLSGALAHELQRAAGVLQAVRSVLELRPAENNSAGLAQVTRDAWAQLQGEISSAPVQASFRAPAAANDLPVPAVLVREAIVDCVRALLHFVSASSALEVSLSENAPATLTMQLIVPEKNAIAATEQREFRGAFDPFDTPGFNFVRYAPGPAFFARVALATAGLSMRLQAQPRSLSIQLTSQPTLDHNRTT